MAGLFLLKASPFLEMNLEKFPADASGCVIYNSKDQKVGKGVSLSWLLRNTQVVSALSTES